jgi:NAD+ synthase
MHGLGAAPSQQCDAHWSFGSRRRGLLLRHSFQLLEHCATDDRFVLQNKYGDGGTDIEPVTHLYKNQVYQLADYLNVIPEIVQRQPSPDTFSLPVTDQEFFFRIAFDKLDYLLYGWEHKVPAAEAASVLGLAEDAVTRAYRDFTAKNQATAHLRVMPSTVENVG